MRARSLTRRFLFFQSVTAPTKEKWAETLLTFVRENDATVFEACGKVLAYFEEQVAVSESFGEFCDVVGWCRFYYPSVGHARARSRISTKPPFGPPAPPVIKSLTLRHDLIDHDADAPPRTDSYAKKQYSSSSL